ncbi:60S ribosomal protein L21 [Manis javanica]|nr:60S ribosomal protein L21 [Manis javanica]
MTTSKDPDSFLKHVKENDQKKKKAKEKGTQALLKHQPACSTQRSTLCENQ